MAIAFGPTLRNSTDIASVISGVEVFGSQRMMDALDHPVEKFDRTVAGD